MEELAPSSVHASCSAKLSRRLVLAPQLNKSAASSGPLVSLARNPAVVGEARLQWGSDTSRRICNKRSYTQLAERRLESPPAILNFRNSGAGGTTAAANAGNRTSIDTIPTHATNSPISIPYKYCIASSSNPYALLDVRYEETKDEFYLSSSVGLTHRQRNGGTEFITRDEHLRQAGLYAALQSIPFFQRFPKWRSFVAWRKSTKLRRFGRCKRRLQHELFFLNPTHRSCLLQLRSICRQIWSLRLFDVDSRTSTDTITDFCERQAQKRFRVEMKLAECTTAVHKVVLHCCRKSLADFLEDCGFGLASTGGGYTQRAAMRAHCQKLVKFIRLIDFQVAETYLQVATMSVSEMMNACLEANQILDTEFIIQMYHEISEREKKAHFASNPDVALASSVALHVFSETKSQFAVADAVSAIITGAKSVPKDTLQEAQAFRPTRAPLFRVSLLLRSLNEELMPQPSGPELRANIEHIITDGVGILNSPPRLLRDREFSPFVTAADEEAAIDNGVNLISILSLDQSFQMMLECIFACLHNASMFAIAYSRGFDCYLDSLREHVQFLNWSGDASIVSFENTLIEAGQQIRGNFSGGDDQQTELGSNFKLSIAELEGLFARYVAESAVFAALPETQRVGVILVDSSRLCSALRPSPRRCLDVTRIYGPDVYNTRTNVLLQKLVQQHEALIIAPVDVNEYVRLTQTLKVANCILPTLHDACDILATLHSLLIAYGTPIPETTVNCAVLLKNIDTQVRQSLNNADTAVQEGAPQFIEQINIEVGALHAPIQASKGKLELDFLAHPTQDPNDALAHLDQVSSCVADLVVRTARVRRYQMALHQELLDAGDLIVLVQLLASLKQLWQTAESWRSQTAVWMEAQCDELDPSVLEDVLRIHSTAFKASVNHLTDNKAAISYCGMTEDFKLVIGLVREFKSAFLRKRHWEAIEDILGFSVSAHHHRDDDDRGLAKPEVSRLSVTLGELIERHAIKALPAIRAIAGRAAREATLHHSLEKVRVRWTGAEFNVLANNGRKDASMLCGLPFLVKQAEDDTITLVHLLESCHASYIIEELKDWHATLARLSMQLHTLAKIQFNLVRLISQFREADSSNVTRSSSDLCSLIPVAEQILNDTEAWWKDLMTSLTVETSITQASVMPAMEQSELEKHYADLQLALNEIRAHLICRRDAFPRLYLCPDETLLAAIPSSSLGNASALASSIVTSCFPAVAALDIGVGLKASKDVSIISADGGRLSIIFDFKMRTMLEEWLNAFDLAMRRALTKALEPCLRSALSFENVGSAPALISENFDGALDAHLEHLCGDFEDSNDSLVWLKQPIQCIIVTMQIVWCHSVERALRPDDGKALTCVILRRQSQYAFMVARLRSISNKNLHVVMSGLLLVASHAVESARHLATIGVSSKEDFNWLATLRHEPRRNTVKNAQTSSGPPALTADSSTPACEHSVGSIEDVPDSIEDCDDVFICMGSLSPIQYGCEYVGAAHTRFLVTPASERCWLSLMTIVSYGFGVRIANNSISASDHLASVAASFAAIVGEPFFAVDCAVAAMSASDSEKSMPQRCARLLRCLTLSSGTWGCFNSINALESDALVLFGAAVNELLHRFQLSKVQCSRHQHVHDAALLKNSSARIGMPRIIVGSSSLCQATQAMESAFRPLAAATPDLARSAVLHLRVAGFDKAEFLGRRAAICWTCLHGFAGHSGMDGRVLDSLHGLNLVLNSLRALERHNDRTRLQPGHESRASQDTEANFVMLFREHVLRYFSSILSIDVFEYLLNDIFEAHCISEAPADAVEKMPCLGYANDKEVVWSALAALAVARWKDSPSSELIFQARRLCDILCSEPSAPDALQITSFVALTGDPGSGKTTVSFAAAALANAKYGVEEIPKGTARPLLSIIAVNALPIEDVWGSFSNDGSWNDGAAGAMIRAATVSSPQTKLSVSEAGKSGCVAGARWVLFDIDGDTSDSASRLDAICAPLICDYMWTHMISKSSCIRSNHAIQLASGERILFGPRTKLLIECGTLTDIAPSALVQFGVFYVNGGVINWSELGSAWAAGACTQLFDAHQCRVVRDASSKQMLLSCLRGRLLHLLQHIFGPIITKFNDIVTISTIPSPTPEMAVRALANHFDAILKYTPSSLELTPLLAATSPVVGTSPHQYDHNHTAALDSTAACLIDPLFVFATAWALGGCMLDHLILRTKLEQILHDCLVAEGITQSASFPPDRRSLSSIYDFWPMLVPTDQTAYLGTSLNVDQPGIISSSDFSVLYADTEDALGLKGQGLALSRGQLPPGFDLSFAGSLTHDTDSKLVMMDHATNMMDPPETEYSASPISGGKWGEQSLIKVCWVSWIRAPVAKGIDITPLDPAQVYVATPTLLRASTLLDSAACGPQRIGALLLGPNGTGKTTIARYASLGSSNLNYDCHEIPAVGPRLEVAMSAACNATRLYADLKTFSLGMQDSAVSLFIDDISVPLCCQHTSSGSFGGGNPRELIRCVLSHHGAACAPSIACLSILDPDSCMTCAISSWTPMQQPFQVLATASSSAPALSKRFIQNFWVYELGLSGELLPGIISSFTQSFLKTDDNLQVNLQIIDAVSEVFSRVAKELPEAPSRPLSAPSGLHAALRIVRGIAGVIDHDRQLYSANPAHIATLFLHECRRVLGDSLGSVQDQVILEESLASVAAQHFNVGGSAWEPKALFRDPERPFIFIDVQDFHARREGGTNDPGDRGAGISNTSAKRRENCRSASQLRSILHHYVSSHNAALRQIQDEEIRLNSIGRLSPINANTMLAGDGAMHVACVLHALKQQKHVLLTGHAGDTRTEIASIASHMAGMILVKARGTNGCSGEELGSSILAALRHAVLLAAESATKETACAQSRPSKIVVLISDESMIATQCHDGLCDWKLSESLSVSLDVLQAVVRNGDTEGKLFSSYSKATGRDIENAIRVGQNLVTALGPNSVTNTKDRQFTDYTEGEIPLAIRSALSANSLMSISIALAVETRSQTGLLRHIKVGYPTLAGFAQVNCSFSCGASACVRSMAQVLEGRLLEFKSQSKELLTTPETIASVCRAILAAFGAAASKKLLLSPILDVVDSIPAIVLDWRQILQSRRHSLLAALDSFKAFFQQPPASIPLESSGDLSTSRILCALSVEATKWSKHVAFIDERLKSLFADATMHAIDVGLACGQSSLQERILICAAAKKSLASRGLVGAALKVENTSITYPFEAAFHAKLADVVLERLVFRNTNTHPHDESLVTAWRAHGCLPRGISAACLALAVVHAPRWPLIIDPVGVGCRWIRSAERLMKSRFFEVSPATALDARTALQDSISQGCSVLLNVDKIPACCSDRSVFEDCLVWHKRHFTGLPKNTPGFRFYFAASASYPVLTDVAVATFSVVVFYMDDVGLRSSLGVSVAARMSSMDLIASFNSVHHAATSLLIAEGVLIGFLGGAIKTECPTHSRKTQHTVVFTADQVVQLISLLKELDLAVNELSTKVVTLRKMMGTNEVRMALTAGAIGAAGHLATVNVSSFVSSVTPSVDHSATLLLSAMHISFSTPTAPLTLRDDDFVGLEETIASAFIQNASCALPVDSSSLFAVELIRCLALQKELVTVDLMLGSIRLQETALNRAVSTSRAWQLLPEGMRMQSSNSALPKVEISTRALAKYVSGLEEPVVSAAPSKELGDFQAALLGKAHWEDKLAGHFPLHSRTMFSLALHLTTLSDPPPPQYCVEMLLQAAHDVFDEAKLNDIKTYKLNQAFVALSGSLDERVHLNILLVCGGSDRADLLNDCGALDFVRRLSCKFSVPRVHVFESRSNGTLAVSTFQTDPATSRVEFSEVIRFLGHGDISRVIDDARVAGEWVLLNNLENFPLVLISLVCQHCEEPNIKRHADFRLLFSANKSDLSTKQIHGVPANSRIFLCMPVDRTTPRNSVNSNNQGIARFEARECFQRKAVKSNLTRLIEQLVSSLGIRRTFFLNAPALIHDGTNAYGIYKALLAQLPKHLDTYTTHQHPRSWRSFALDIEARRHNAVISMCRVTLIALVEDSSHIRERSNVGLEIKIGMTPHKWLEATHHFFPSESNTPILSRWLASLQGRVEYLREWSRGGQPFSIWLGVLFSPKTYLQGALLDIDRDFSNRGCGSPLSFVATPVERAEAKVSGMPSGSFLVEGLSLLHALWDPDSRVLVAPQTREDTLSAKGPAPLLLLTPNSPANLEGRCASFNQVPSMTVSGATLAHCPLYSIRQNERTPLLALYLPFRLKQKHPELAVHLHC